jgi:hypothetical protein
VWIFGSFPSRMVFFCFFLWIFFYVID